MKKGILFSEIPTPTIVQKDNGGGKEVEAERKKLASEFVEITRHPDADKVYIEMDVGYKILRQTIQEFAQANIDMLNIVKDTPIEGDAERVR